MENTNRENVGVRAGLTGIVVNTALFGFKLVGGIISGSVALTADAFNNLSDSGSSVVSMLGFKIASAPPDSEHPYGHGRAEYISGLIVSLIIILVGAELFRDSIGHLIHPTDVNYGVFALCVTGLGIVAKFALGLYYFRAAKKINSPALKAAGVDSFFDTISTFTVVVGAIVYTVFGYNIDAYAGLIVALLIVTVGIKTANDCISPLIGKPVSRETVAEITDYAKTLKGIIGVHDLMVHNYGEGRNILTFHAEVNGETDFYRAHELIDSAEIAVRNKFGYLTTIHLDPVFPGDFELKRNVELLVTDIDPSLTLHDFRKTNGIDHENLIFDIVIPFGFRLSDSEVISRIKNKITKLDPKYSAVIHIDRPY
ncbi:MAG: cation diffusion facilitator family transporter [Oscillospiraceae bacterium]|jgi:cation diffusion facilitator family transporter|nr:cation diffusion facilitator family transporter [Oscillospiraceae bacterium]